jgi:hypothetical protein
MSSTPLSDKVMAIFKEHRLLNSDLESELRKLFSMSLDDLKAQDGKVNQDPAQIALADQVADSLMEKLGIKNEPAGPTQEQSLRALYPSLEHLRHETNERKPDDQRTALEALYPSMTMES